ncbi:hypothetical protein [Algoriphagus boritolerans]|uniref:Uncharacterized protein n=1 Tax=Algoriphagus boritolerans DSM 17298 = JCM 18970 TaxID=1120964 RepID=A0A1H5YKN3_9BACT|nr:hypothetical protein [Algoriphagus boritolerans]SEG24681.1 hypothetical protein SAMN03080598_03059 [Algoriphagus boritolerans DSM 17298 = JCM 18970]
MKGLFYLLLVFTVLSCNRSENLIEIQEFDLSDLIVDTLFLEKDTLTRDPSSQIGKQLYDHAV